MSYMDDTPCMHDIRNIKNSWYYKITNIHTLTVILETVAIYGIYTTG